MPDLHISGLSKAFDDNVALDDVSIDGKDGELLTLLGPDTSFAGTALPTADWLRSGWASGTFSIAGPELGYLMVANINSITVSAVPEPAAAALLLAGLGVLGLLHAGSAARRRRTGTAPDERFTAAY